jgi:hypothetical protein
MSALRLINETEFSETVTNISIDNVFSADFDIYQITLHCRESGGGLQGGVGMRFINTSGSVISSSSYDSANLRLLVDSTSEDKATNGTSLLHTALGFTDELGTVSTCYIFNPYSSSSYTFTLGQGNFYTTKMQTEKGIGVFKSAETVRGFNLITDTGSFGSGTIKTYGLRVDNG